MTWWTFFGEELEELIGYGIRSRGFSRGRSLAGQCVVCTARISSRGSCFLGGLVELFVYVSGFSGFRQDGVGMLSGCASVLVQSGIGVR